MHISFFCLKSFWQIKELETELGIQKAANARAPTSTMKNLVERLKNELALKEQQHQVS